MENWDVCAYQRSASPPKHLCLAESSDKLRLSFPNLFVTSVSKPFFPRQVTAFVHLILYLFFFEFIIIINLHSYKKKSKTVLLNICNKYKPQCAICYCPLLIVKNRLKPSKISLIRHITTFDARSLLIPNEIVH
jgi:hypothetical protein